MGEREPDREWDGERDEGPSRAEEESLAETAEARREMGRLDRDAE